MKNQLSALIMMICIICGIRNIGVCAASEGENIALNKTAYSSGCYSVNTPAKNVVDGSLNTIWASGSVGADDGIEAYSVVIDLEKTYLINEINVRTRRDMDFNWSRRGWKIYVSASRNAGGGVLVGEKKVAGLFGEDLEIKLDNPVSGRYIIAVVERSSAVSEIEVYGSDYHEDGMYQKKYTDIKSDAVNIASYLGIVDGTSDYKFDSHMLVTRGEAAKYAVSLLNISPYRTDSFFTDVDSNNKYYSYIMTAAAMGIVSVGESFNPDEYVSLLDFYTMLLRALGCGEAVKYHGGYPAGVIYELSQIKLANGVEQSFDDYLSRGSAAEIVYNALKSKPVGIQVNEGASFGYKVQEKNVLNAKFNLRLLEGVAEANNSTSFTSIADNSKGCMYIDKIKYEDATGELYRCIGKNIMFLADDNNIIVSGWETKNKVKCFEAKELEDISENSLSYYSTDGKRASIRLNDVRVLKNYEAYTEYAFDKSYFNQNNAYIEVFENNDDGAYEIINILTPTPIRTDSIVYDEERLYITGENGKSYKFDNYDNIFIKNDGEEYSKRIFMQSKLILLYETESKKNILIESFSNEVKGSVEGFSEDVVFLNGKKYSLTDYFKQSVNTALAAGENITLLTDDKERVFYAFSDSAAEKGERIGMLTRIFTNEREDVITFRIFNDSGEFGNYRMSDNGKIDKVKYTAEEILAKRNELVGYFVMFRINAAGDISYLKTEKAATAENGPYKISGVKKDCRRVGNGVFSGQKMLFPIKNEIKIFVLPYSGSGLLTGDSYEKYYSISNMQETFKYNDAIFRTNDAFYCPDEYGFPGFGVFSKEVASSEHSYSAAQDLSAPIVVINNIINAVNSDNEPVISISGMNINSGGSFSGTGISYLTSVIRTDSMVKSNDKTYMINKRYINNSIEIPEEYLDSVSALGKGDLVRLNMDNGTILGIELICRASDKSIYTYSFGESPDNAYSSANIHMVSVENTGGGLIEYKTQHGTEKRMCESYTNVYVFDSEKRAYAVPSSAASNYCSFGDKAVSFITDGKENTLLIYSDN